MEHVIPKHLSKEFSSLKTKELKLEFLNKYYNWLEDTNTLLFLSYLKDLLEEEIRLEEKENMFVSLFQSKYKHAHSKGRRSILRELIKLGSRNV